MTGQKKDAPPPGLALAQLLGVTDEMATNFIQQGHVILTEGKKHTYLRLHDIYQSLRKSSAARGARATA